MRRKMRNAFTMLEMLVVIAVIGILIALLLPAVQAARENARRFDCVNNMTQLIMGVHNYEHAYKVYPPGVIDTGHGWLVQILPFMEERVAFRKVDLDQPVGHVNNAAVRRLWIDILMCPSNASLGQNRNGDAITPYAAVHHDLAAPIGADNHGVFFLNSKVRYKDVSDGTAQTLFIGEKQFECRGANDDGWMAGSRATLRNTGSTIKRHNYMRYSNEPPTVTGFGTVHIGGANFAFGDGRVRFLLQDMELHVLQQLAHRADGKLLKADY